MLKWLPYRTIQFLEGNRSLNISGRIELEIYDIRFTIGAPVPANRESEIANQTGWGCSSVGRAVALQAIGQEFDSPQLHQSEKRSIQIGPVAQLVRACA